MKQKTKFFMIGVLVLFGFSLFFLTGGGKKAEEVTLTISVAFAAFVSVASTFIGIGYSYGNLFFVYFGIAALVLLFIVVMIIMRYYSSERIEKTLDRNIEKELIGIRERFIKDKKA